MRPTTAQLLALLRAAAPEREFRAHYALTPDKDDRIHITDHCWLNVDAHEDAPMVTLTDEARQTGGQIAFWFIRSPAMLPEVASYALQLGAPATCET